MSKEKRIETKSNDIQKILDEDDQACDDLGKVSILGTDYDIWIVPPKSTESDYDRSMGGYCEPREHTIAIVDLWYFDDYVDMGENTIAAEMKHIMRHEIVHAYLEESGLSCCSRPVYSWADNEEMIDWFAVQGPKIAKTWEILDDVIDEWVLDAGEDIREFND